MKMTWKYLKLIISATTDLPQIWILSLGDQIKIEVKDDLQWKTTSKY